MKTIIKGLFRVFVIQKNEKDSIRRTDPEIFVREGPDFFLVYEGIEYPNITTISEPSSVRHRNAI